jgi:hypothetical protein
MEISIEIGLYDSGDPEVAEYQLQLMKYAGVTGVLIDWPGTKIKSKSKSSFILNLTWLGTLDVWDYAGNKENSEVIIELAQKVGLTFAIVYEDHNIKVNLGRRRH